MNDQARAMLIVGALLSGASFSAGGVAGRMTAPVPASPPPAPAEVRFVEVPAWAVPVLQPVQAPPPVEAALPEAEPPAPPEPPAAASAPAAEVKPVPKVEAKSKPKPKPVAPPKPRAAAPPKRSLPSCELIKREYARMTWSQKMAEYSRATPAEIAHGKRCLGM